MTRSDLERASSQAPIEDLSLERLRQRRERGETRRRLATSVVALTIGALVVTSVLVAFRGPGSEPRPGSGGTAPAAWTMPAGLAIPEGSFVYVHRVEYPAPGDEGFPADRRSWFSPSDGSGRVKESGKQMDQPLDSGTQGHWAPYSYDHSYGPGEVRRNDYTDLSMIELGGLSTDPAVLADQLAQRSQPFSPASPDPNVPKPTGSIAIAADMVLSFADSATPELKAAASQVLAGLEGVTTDTATSDPVGRPAWSVRLAQGSQVETWWFDPRSDQLLANALVESDHTTFTIYEAAGVVDGTGVTSPEPAFIPATTEVPSGAKG